MITVLANGVFDLLHYGHLLHLEEARKMGDRLVVAITDDKHVNKTGRPIVPQQQRWRMVEALRCVDRAFIVSGLMEALELVEPQIIVKGKDYTELEPEHKAYCLAHGIVMAFIDTPKYSTTDIINEIRRRS